MEACLRLRSWHRYRHLGSFLVLAVLTCTDAGRHELLVLIDDASELHRQVRAHNLCFFICLAKSTV